MSESTAHGRQLLKEKICLTALRLFHKRGIRQVKMDDIATTLSVSKRTLYEIYTNKMELLAEVLELQNRMNHDRLKRELKPEANTYPRAEDFGGGTQQNLGGVSRGSPPLPRGAPEA